MTQQHHRTPRASAVTSALARVVGADLPGFEAAWGRAPWLYDGPGYDDLLDLAGIDELLSTRGLRTPFLRVAKNGSTLPDRSFTAGGGVGAAIADQVSDARLAHLFADGSTLVLQALHRTWAPIAEFTAALAGELGHPVQANAYVTPPQSQGFSAHYDVHDVFVLQLAGEKRWIIHEPVLTWPMRDEPWDSGGRREQVATAAEGDAVLDVVLRPGDCLYLPRGYLHSARALGGVSAHLTLGIHVWTRHHLATEMMRRALAQADDLRRPLDLGVQVGDADTIAADTAAVRTALIEAIEHLDDDDLAALMDARADDTGRPEPVRPLAQAAAARDLTPDTPVRLRRHLRLRRTDASDGVRLQGRGVDVLLEASPDLDVLDALLDGGVHTAAELDAQFGGESQGDGTALVARLVAAGVLVPA
ncbi:cupin domain-containing protein [Mobilicoccus caccae]|uniref:JmjC domain-containing protein n=1 Tax=Mobilicoccus caccae TaxID=1859295 RepID=A0ABQ6IPU9_9MICO|nr:cupin domain-containing protein [Mobilicoccus caccae]GMA39121.1 hypothetical protein GCM10025883_11660 [Mobilicoccus caccae]